ncbi:hypothetical protein Gotur_017444 [Gossypium turneri]
MIEMLQEISDHKSKGAFEKVVEIHPANLVEVIHTTLLTKLNNKFSTTPNNFDVVIWALVSKDYHVGNIQDRIGGDVNFLDGSWKNKSVEQKAIDISGVLSNKKSVVLLDDL